MNVGAAPAPTPPAPPAPLSEHAARSGRGELEAAGFLRRAGQADRSFLWQLGEPHKVVEAPVEVAKEEPGGDWPAEDVAALPLATPEQEAECQRLTEKWGAP